MRTSAGVFFYSRSTNRFMFVMRTDIRTVGMWGIPGGKMEDGESLVEGIKRECMEELGYLPKGQLIPIQKFSKEDFTYHTFFCEIETEFIPNLNHEHCAYAWFDVGVYPTPMHPGVFNTVNLETVQSKLHALVSKSS